MEHFVVTNGSGRVAVAYMLHGTSVASIVQDFPEALRADAEAEAQRLTRATAAPKALAPPEERIPRRDFSEQISLL